MLKDKWLIVKVVFLHTNLSWEKMFSFYCSEVAKQEKVDKKNPFPPSVYIVQIFFVTLKLYPCMSVCFGLSSASVTGGNKPV